MNIIALPIFLPLLLIVVLLIIRSKSMAHVIGPAGSFILLLVSLAIFALIRKHEVLVLNVGGWDAPFGIILVADYLSGMMLVITNFIIFAISIFALRFLSGRLQPNRFYIFFFALAMGINGAYMTGDIFNLYVWFEVILISSFILLTMGKTKSQYEGGIKYLALNLIGSLLFLAGIGILYGKTGTLNMAHLAELLKHDEQSLLMNTSGILFFVSFGIKSAVFPLYFWLPASYHTPNIVISSLFAGIVTKVGVYTYIRFFTLFFVHDPQFWNTLLLVIAGLTMITGGMAAATYYESRKILSYHIISQIGYMIMGLGIFTPLAISGAVFFTMHNMIAKTGTFVAAGVAAKIKHTFALKQMGGLYRQNLMLAILFLIPAFALAGVPPLSGFFAKFILVKAGIENGNFVIVAVALITALLTLYSMIKIWNEAFLKKQPDNKIAQKKDVKLLWIDYVPLILLGLASIFMGVFASVVFDWTSQAADQLVDPQHYIRSVLQDYSPGR